MALKKKIKNQLNVIKLTVTLQTDLNQFICFIIIFFFNTKLYSFRYAVG